VSTKLLTAPTVFNCDGIVGLSKDPTGLHAAAISREELMIFGFHKCKSAETQLLAKLSRSREDICRNGENTFIVWSPDGTRVAVVTNQYRVLLFKVKYSDKKIVGRLSLPSVTQKRLRVIGLVQKCVVKLQCLPRHSAEVVGALSVENSILIGTQNVHFITLGWDGQVEKSCQIFPDQAEGTGLRHFCVNEKIALLGMTLIDGRVSICGLNHVVRTYQPTDLVGRDPQILPVGEATCADFNERYGLVAVGNRRGDVRVLKLDCLGDSLSFEQHFKVIGLPTETTGAVDNVLWSECGSSLFVGWDKQAFSVYAADGTRVLCPFLDAGGPKAKYLFQARVQAAAWVPHGLMLGMSETSEDDALLCLWDSETWAQGNLCPTAASRKTLVTPGGIKIWAPERLLQKEDEEDYLEIDPWEHIDIPDKLLKAAWPFKEVSANENLHWLAVASYSGLILLYQRIKNRWSVIKLEKLYRGGARICSMSWVAQRVLCAALERRADGKTTYSLNFFSRRGELLSEVPLVMEPLGLEEQKGLLLVYFSDRVVYIYTVDVQKTVTVRNYSVFSPIVEVEHPTRVRLWCQSDLDSDTSARVVVLRMGGRLSIHDLQGRLLFEDDRCQDFFLQPVSLLPNHDTTQLWVNREGEGVQLWLPHSHPFSPWEPEQKKGEYRRSRTSTPRQTSSRFGVVLGCPIQPPICSKASNVLRPPTKSSHYLSFECLSVHPASSDMVPLGIDANLGVLLGVKRVWRSSSGRNPEICIRTQLRTYFDSLLPEILSLEGVDRTAKFVKQSIDHGLYEPVRAMELFLRDTMTKLNPKFAVARPGAISPVPEQIKSSTPSHAKGGPRIRSSIKMNEDNDRSESEDLEPSVSYSIVSTTEISTRSASLSPHREEYSPKSLTVETKTLANINDIPPEIEFLQKLPIYEEVVINVVRPLEAKRWPEFFNLCGQADILFYQCLYQPRLKFPQPFTRKVEIRRLRTAAKYLYVLERLDFFGVDKHVKRLLVMSESQGIESIVNAVKNFMERLELIKADVAAGVAPPSIYG